MATALADKQRNTIITAALRKLAVIAKGETPASADFTQADVSLNLLVKHLDALPQIQFKEELTARTAAWTAGTSSLALASGVHSVRAAYFTVTASGQKLPLTMSSQSQVVEGVNRTSASPEFLYVTPLTTGATTVTAHLSPVPNANGTLTYWARGLVDIFDNSTDPADIPDHWIRWLVWELAADLAWDYRKDLEEIDRLQRKADQLFEQVMSGEMQAIRQPVLDQPNDQNDKQA